MLQCAKNLRELAPKVDSGDYKAVESWLTSPWSAGVCVYARACACVYVAEGLLNAGTARFVRKNKVLESLSTSVKGASAGASSHVRVHVGTHPRT